MSLPDMEREKNMEKHGGLPVPVRRNRGINMAVVEVMFQRNPFEITGGQELMLSVVLHQNTKRMKSSRLILEPGRTSLDYRLSA